MSLWQREAGVPPGPLVSALSRLLYWQAKPVSPAN
ncbi:uncharacterized protein FTOL_13982 [Fusarium torulosum]|uniref:Uncharacterized protein n=1 Tax=Fusarium torulosum TaxID=33205 RepID=A0AAE8SQC6_9HYPO|nr:uncharacterized protein FTOL_13982 [Fusarium torulosum]